MIFTHIRTKGLYVKTTLIYHLKRLCDPDCAYTESKFINSIHISLYDISRTQNILYRIKRDVAIWKRLGCPQRNQRTWWQIVATPYTGLAKFTVVIRVMTKSSITIWWSVFARHLDVMFSGDVISTSEWNVNHKHLAVWKVSCETRTFVQMAIALLFKVDYSQ